MWHKLSASPTSGTQTSGVGCCGEVGPLDASSQVTRVGSRFVREDTGAPGLSARQSDSERYQQHFADDLRRELDEGEVGRCCRMLS
jgi:hypothetical protein